MTALPDIDKIYNIELFMEFPYDPHSIPHKIPDKNVFDFVYNSKANHWLNWT